MFYNSIFCYISILFLYFIEYNFYISILFYLIYFSIEQLLIQFLRFSFDGTKLYTTGFSANSGIRQYTLSTAWDVSTASYDSAIETSSTTEALFISGDGTDIVFSRPSDFVSVNLSTPWDLSTASTPVYVITSGSSRWGAYITPTADILVSYNRSNNTLYEYTIWTGFTTQWHNIQLIKPILNLYLTG